MLLQVFQQAAPGTLLLLGGALLLAFLFEAVNGFHDTANAVATVIYTKSLRPTTAVVWSGICNMLGILIGGIGVAFAIVHLLPLDLLVNINSNAGMAMIFSLLIAALIWNLGTWKMGLPASSSHALIGSILGVGIANSLMMGRGFWGGVNMGKVGSIALSLLLSPTIGFMVSAGLLFAMRKTKVRQTLDKVPMAGERPPWWIRGVLCLTCTGVSLAHGSNDGQKGMGVVMLILIAILPAQFALNLQHPEQAKDTFESIVKLEHILETDSALLDDEKWSVKLAAVSIPSFSPATTREQIHRVSEKLVGKNSFEELPEMTRLEFRQDLMKLDTTLSTLELRAAASKNHNLSSLKKIRQSLRRSIEYVPTWVVVCVALALGFGTMFGWKRIVVTVGEKIGKSHLTYGQGASAELVAMSTIGMADIIGLPVSTTHVLSSGVAGTMWANRSGINGSTVKNIAIAWVLTLPATIFLSATFFFLARLMVG